MGSSAANAMEDKQMTTMTKQSKGRALTNEWAKMRTGLAEEKRKREESGRIGGGSEVVDADVEAEVEADGVEVVLASGICSRHSEGSKK